MKKPIKALAVAGFLALAGLAAGVTARPAAAQNEQQPVCSAWLMESSRFMNVPFGVHA
jgi:hypothetical protein